MVSLNRSIKLAVKIRFDLFANTFEAYLKEGIFLDQWSISHLQIQHLSPDLLVVYNGEDNGDLQQIVSHRSKRQSSIGVTVCVSARIFYSGCYNHCYFGRSGINSGVCAGCTPLTLAAGAKLKASWLL